MQTARHEASLAELPSIPFRGFRTEARDIALDVVCVREKLEPRNAAGVYLYLFQCSAELRSPDVVEHPAADNQIKAFGKLVVQLQLFERLDGAEPQFPARAKASDRVLARLHSHIAQPRSHGAQNRLPVSLPRPDVEYSADGAIQDVLRGGDRKCYDASDLRRRADTMLTAPIPLVEIRLVVRHVRMRSGIVMNPSSAQIRAP